MGASLTPSHPPPRARRPLTRLILVLPFMLVIMVALTIIINYSIFELWFRRIVIAGPSREVALGLRWAIALNSLMLVLAGVAGLLLSRELVRPLRILSAGMEEFARRGSAQTIPLLSSSEEFAALGESFNRIVSSTSKYLPENARFIFHNLASGVLSFDQEGRVKLINAAADRMLELAGKGVGGRLLSEVFPPDSGYAALSAALAPERTLTQPLENTRLAITTAAGNEKELGVSTVAVPAPDGSGIEIVTTLMDLSRLREISERMIQVEKLSAVGSLAAGVAHEIRNPLASLRGLSQLLQESSNGKQDSAAEETHRFAEVMLREIDRLNTVVTRLLDFSGPSRDEWKESRVAEVVQRGLELAGHPLRRKGIQVQVEAASDLPPVVWCEDKILQAILNILINGVEAAPDRGRLSIRAALGRAARGDGDELTLSLSNNGPALSPEQLRQIFLPYYTTKESGVGLGLAITQQIIMGHGGRLVAENTPEGVSFSFSLPVRRENGVLLTSRIESSTELT